MVSNNNVKNEQIFRIFRTEEFNGRTEEVESQTIASTVQHTRAHT